jgi:hypothetical protein
MNTAQRLMKNLPGRKRYFAAAINLEPVGTFEHVTQDDAGVAMPARLRSGRERDLNGGDLPPRERTCQVLLK